MMRPSVHGSAAAALAVAILLGAAPPPAPRPAQDLPGAARVWEEALVIPTYLPGPAEPNPVFYTGRAYQGAQGPVYPYPLIDRLTDLKQDKTYRAVYLENRFIKLCVLPELGGRLFAALDKTNGRDFLYRQSVIKPALIGMLGAWISGGVEWNIPHHHRATTFMPVEHITVASADGSATVWVGETELRHRTRWFVGLTLRPDSSAIEVTLRTFNRTPLARSMLAWANAAVKATPDYQVIFPPDTTVAAFHGKNQFSRWPISTEVFNGQDYRAGVDVSRLKSHARPTSFFAFNGAGDFLAGYDHARDAGVCFVADHNFVPGKKLWTWGTGAEGALWERILTDADGPYAELMVGAFSDNQPDYSWTRPFETRTAKQWWYPLRGLSGVKAATREAACDLEFPDGRTARIGLVATRDHADARVVLSRGVRTVFEETIAIGPARPYRKETPVPEGVRPEDLSLTLWTAEGRELVRYKTVVPGAAALPAPLAAPPAPQDISTIEELYLTGLRLEQFHNPVLESAPYFEEALRRDPGDLRTNTALGILDLERGMYKDAEDKLARAADRASRGYTRPKDGEALYYLGVARRARGRTDEAREAFYRAAWDEGWQGASFLQLAEMACVERDYGKALELLDRARAKNTQSPRLTAFAAALHRTLGDLDKAKAAAQETLGLDPLDFWGWNETALHRAAVNADEGRAVLRRMATLMRDAPANILELAADYARIGLWDAAAEVLRRPVEARRKGDGGHPLILYMLAYAYGKLGETAKAEETLRAAAAASPDYAFPFQLEFVEILSWAREQNPRDARAPYYLGNLLFDIQPGAALDAFEKAVELDPAFPTARRNLGLAYARVKNDPARAVRELEAAAAASPADARLHEELDRMSEAAGEPAELRLRRLEKNQAAVAGRDDALSREIQLLILLGRFDRAVALLENRHFHVWEGGGAIHGLFVEAHVRRGEKSLGERKAPAALKDFEAALTYPPNLEVASPPGGGGTARIYYLIGLARESLGAADEARAAFERAASFRHGPSEAAYYEALALAKLGRADEAAGKLSALEAYADRSLKDAPAPDFFEKFGEKQSAGSRIAEARYLKGLSLLGQGKAAEAAAEFRTALAANPYHIGAAQSAGKTRRRP